MKSDKILKIVSITCLDLLITALIAARNAPAIGYEPSIYVATPPLVWVFLAIVIVCGIGIIVHQVFTGKTESHNIWLLGLALILLACTAILLLYAVRGYAMLGRGDFSSHLVFITDIISTGHVAGGNIYPGTHVYIAELSLVFGVSPLTISKFVMPVLFLFYVLTVFLLSKICLPSRGQAILATIATTTLVPFISGWLITPCPNHVSNMFIPLALLLFLKSRNAIRFSILFLILLFLIPMLHPVTTIALLLILLVIGLPQLLFIFSRQHRIEFGDIRFQDCTIPLSLLFVWGFIWFSAFYFFDQMLISTYIAIIESTQSKVEILFSDIGLGQKYGYSATVQFINVYGGYLLFVILTAISLPILIRRRLPVVYLRRLGSFWNMLAVMVLVIVLLYAIDIELHPARFFPYFLLACTIFVGLVLYELLSNKWLSHYKNHFIRLFPSFAMVIIFTLSFLSGILNLYDSPFRLAANDQVTRTELAGMSWFLDTRSTDIKVSTIFIPFSRFAFMLSGENIGIEEGSSAVTLPPYHFGYDQLPTLGDSYTEDSYMLLGKIDRDIYAYVWSKAAKFRWLPSDFERLEIDNSLGKIYSSSGFDAWYVRHMSIP